jgi:periplasmic protein TonB
MFNSPFLRLVVALVIAVPIVYALFILMSSLINVTEIRVDKT